MPSYVESAHQKAFVQWFRLQYPSCIITTFGGGNVGPVVGARLKAMGQRKGMPDLLIAVPKSPWHGLFIEMKTKGGKASEEQQRVHDALRAQGYKVNVCWSCREAMDVCKDYFKQ